MTPRELEWQLEDYLRTLLIHRRLLLAATCLFALLGALYFFQRPNLYEASAKVLIEAQPPRVVQQFQEVYPGAGGMWVSHQVLIQTELKIILSRATSERAVEEMNLAAFPPFNKSSDPAGFLLGMVDATPIRGTKLVEITATTQKPELSAQVANGIAASYAQMNLERRREMTVGGIQWLKDEIVTAEERMKKAQLALQQFKEEHQTIAFGQEEQNTILQRLQQLNSAVTEAKKQRIEAETKYRANHPILIELTSKERELEEALRQQEKIVLEMNRLSIEFNNLQRDATSSETIYNVLLNRLKELSVQEGLQTNNIQVVEEAQVPSKPVGPKRAQGIFSFTVLGFVLGCGLAFVLEILAKTIRTRTQFESILEIPFLGSVPLIRAGRGKAELPSLLLLTEPKSNASESVRSIRTTLEFLLPSDKPQVLLITSALPEEGKTVISLNLAIALQELGRKTLLIDADLRRPILHRSLQVNLEPGLSGYLQEQAEIPELIQIASLAKDLPVLPAGVTPQQPTDLLTGPRMHTLIEALKREYQYLILDSPPVLAVADPTALAGVVDGVLYIVRADRTHRDAAVSGKQRLIDVGAKIIGGILNGMQLELERGYRYYYYYREGRRVRKEAISPSASTGT